MEKSSFPFGNARKLFPFTHPALEDGGEEGRVSKMRPDLSSISPIISADPFKAFSI